MSYQPKFYRELGGDKAIVASGGEIEVQSGGTLDVQSGSTLTLAGTMTATGTLNQSGASNFTGAVTTGVDDTGVDVKFFGATASAALLWDESDDALELNGDSRIDFSGNTVKAGNTDGGLIKAGTSGARVVEDTANMKFLSFYLDNGATSGDNRAMYLRLYLTGAGGGGEACRIFTDVEDVAGGTAHGAHISLKFGTSGSITGQGVANRNTLHIPAAMTGGTYYVNQQEIWADAAASDVAGVTNQAFTNYNLGGDSTGAALIEDSANLFHITGGTNASGNMVGAVGNEPTWASKTHLIRCNMNGTVVYLVGVQL